MLEVSQPSINCVVARKKETVPIQWPCQRIYRGTSEVGKIPYIDLVGQHAPIKSEIMAAIGEVIDSGQFILGDQVAEFESKFAELCGVKYAVGVNSGTDAGILALKALGIGSGDEVITAPNSFIASASCIRVLGAKPVFVDVRDDYNIDPDKIAAAITPKTKAILPVHLTGRPCDMEPILALAKEKGLFVVEDAAQAVMSEYKGKRVGSFGDIGCFSLHPLKTLNACGDGGILTTNDPELYEKLKIMRNIGLKTRDDCVVWSHNSRLDTMQAAILLVKLRYLEQWTEQRRQNALYYQEGLTSIDQVKVPQEKENEKCVYHTFVIQADNRDELRQFLAEKEIGTSVHYPVPIHFSTAGKELGYPAGSFPVTETQAGRILSLPIYQGLTKDQIERVCQTIKEFYQI
ncbi:MAG: DegT/DnrJ/EryC1/StrS family aminotransferase [Moorea sp. SIO2B7]|nr:DegT/DnrJ/EryC1/StrS family aminotransferase [Moorena sp. SIO2B7]